MKNLFVFFTLIFCFSQSKVSAQFINYGISHWIFDSTNFNNTPNWIKADTCSQPLWQIGQTNKASFAGTRGIVTDTMSAVGASQNHFFEVKVAAGSYSLTTFSFVHKMNGLKGHCGGYITYFSPKDSMWYPLVPRVGQWFTNGASYRGTDNFYWEQDTLFNGLCGYDQQDTVWKRSVVQLQWLIPSKGTWGFNEFDTTRFRFHFVSDTSASVGDGWMIKNISLINVYTWGGISETEMDNELHCNSCMEGELQVGTKNNLPGTILLVNCLGQTVLSQEYNGDSALLNTANLSQGIYILALYDKGGKLVAKKKVVK